MTNKIPVIFGMSGLTLTEAEKSFFENKNIYGLIIFQRNIESKNQLINLLAELKNITKNETKIFVDQEGGKVQRILPPIAKYEFPSGGFFGEIYDQLGREFAIKLATQSYYNLMLDLKKLGVDVTFAPDADLVFPHANNIIGSRSFDYDAKNNVKRTVELCQAAFKGLEKGGGKGVLKHMPGHGRALVDSHKDLPTVDAPLAELLKTDFAVFKELSKSSNEQTLAMTAHIIYTALDPANPATLSPILNDYIRKEIGYKGIIITDDICMHALHKNIDLSNVTAYHENLVKIAQSASKLGHTILHCSGDLNEMIEIVKGIESPVTTT